MQQAACTYFERDQHLQHEGVCGDRGEEVAVEGGLGVIADVDGPALQERPSASPRLPEDPHRCTRLMGRVALLRRFVTGCCLSVFCRPFAVPRERRHDWEVCRSQRKPVMTTGWSRRLNTQLRHSVLAGRRRMRQRVVSRALSPRVLVLAPGTRSGRAEDHLESTAVPCGTHGTVGYRPCCPLGDRLIQPDSGGDEWHVFYQETPSAANSNQGPTMGRCLTGGRPKPASV